MFLYVAIRVLCSGNVPLPISRFTILLSDEPRRLGLGGGLGLGLRDHFSQQDAGFGGTGSRLSLICAG